MSAEQVTAHDRSLVCKNSSGVFFPSAENSRVETVKLRKQIKVVWTTYEEQRATPFSQSFELNLKHCFQLSQKKKYRLLRCNEGTTSDLLEEKICVKAIVRVLWCFVAEIIKYLWRNIPSRALQSVFELFQFYRRLKWFLKRFIRLR